MNNDNAITVLQIRISGVGEDDPYDACFVNLSRITVINLERKSFGITSDGQFFVHPEDWQHFLFWFQRMT